MDDISAGDESPPNGRSPVAISYSMMPSEKMSVRGSRGLASICSGDMYGIVPTIVPSSVSGSVSPALTVRLRFDGADQAEVQHLHAPVVRDHDVGGLQVAVREVLAMRRGQRVGQRDRDVEELRQRDAASGYQLVERAPLDQFHRHEPDAVGLLGREDRDDVRVVEGGDGVGFAREPRELHLDLWPCRRQRHL